MHTNNNPNSPKKTDEVTALKKELANTKAIQQLRQRVAVLEEVVEMLKNQTHLLERKGRYQDKRIERMKLLIEKMSAQIGVKLTEYEESKAPMVH